MNHLQRTLSLILALVVLVAVQECEFHQLAGDGGGALGSAAEQVVDQRSAYALEVHAVVFIEA